MAHSYKVGWQGGRPWHAAAAHSSAIGAKECVLPQVGLRQGGGADYIRNATF